MKFLCHLSFVLTIIAPTLAAAQGALLQGGPWAPGHAPQYTGQGSGQAIVSDSGPASGGAVGLGLSELNITARGTGTAPYAGQGTGPFGSIFCAQDAPTTNATGYHYFCISPNTSGAGVLSYGAGGAAAAQPLSFNVNGTVYTLPTPVTPTAAVAGGSATGTGLATGSNQYGGGVFTGAGTFTSVVVTWGPNSGINTAPFCTVTPLIQANVQTSYSTSLTTLSIVTATQNAWYYYTCAKT